MKTARGVLLIAFGLWVASFAGPSTRADHSSRLSGLPTNQSQLKPGDKEFQEGGLPAAAAAVGNYLRLVPYQAPTMPSTLSELVKLSEIICIGAAHTNSSHLTQNNRSIAMVLEVLCTDVLKGTLDRRAVNIVVPGGRVAFGRATAELRVKDFPLPIMNAQTMWFLHYASDENARLPRTENADSKMLEPSNGPLSIYDLTLKSIRPNGAPRSVLARRISSQRMSAAAFEAAVRAALR